MSCHRFGILALALLALAAAGCGEYIRQSRSPSQVVIMSLQAASGAEPGELGGTLHSDVVTVVERTKLDGTKVEDPTVFSDNAEVVMALILRDPGQPGIASAPSAINQVTFSRYRVTYRRSDGRNTAGVDVPYPFDGAATFTVPAEGTVSAGFEIVRHVAKEEAPLRALGSSRLVISTICEVTFYGRDQAGNDVQASGMILIDFGNFGDPS